MLKFVVNRATNNKSNQFSPNHQHSSKDQRNANPNFTLIQVPSVPASDNKKHTTPYIVKDSSRTLTTSLLNADKKNEQKPVVQDPITTSADENGGGPTIEAVTSTPTHQNRGSLLREGVSSSGGYQNGALPQRQQQQRMVHQQQREYHHNHNNVGQQNQSQKFATSSPSPSSTAYNSSAFYQQRHPTVPLNNNFAAAATGNNNNNRKSPAPRPRMSKAATTGLSSFPVVNVNIRPENGLNTKTTTATTVVNNNNNNKMNRITVDAKDVNGITVDAKDLALMQMNGFTNNNNNNKTSSNHGGNHGDPRIVVVSSNKNEQKLHTNNNGQHNNIQHQKHSTSRGINSNGVPSPTSIRTGAKNGYHHARSLSVSSNPIKTIFNHTSNMLKNNSQNLTAISSTSTTNKNNHKVDNRYVDGIDLTNFVPGDNNNNNDANKRPTIDVGMLISRKQRQIDNNNGVHLRQQISSSPTVKPSSSSNKNGIKSHQHQHHNGSTSAIGVSAAAVSRSLSRTTAFTAATAASSSSTTRPDVAAGTDGYEKPVSSPRSSSVGVGHHHTISNAGVVLNGFGGNTRGGMGNSSGSGGGLASTAAVRHRPGLNGLINGSAGASTSAFALSNQQQHNHPTVVMMTNPLISNNINSNYQHQTSSLLPLTSNNNSGNNINNSGNINNGSKGLFHTHSSSSSSTSTSTSTSSPPSSSSGHSPPNSSSVDDSNLVQIRIRPDSQGRFGFNVKGGSDQNHAIIVSRVVPGSPADQCFPRLNEGDQVLFINGRDVATLTHEQVVRYIRSARESSPHKQLHLTVRPNAYMGEDMDEPDFQYVPESPTSLPGHPYSSNASHLSQSILILRDALSSGGAAITQFEQLYRKKPGMSMDISKATENLAKNRYRDVLPYDSTRVVLRKSPTGDYINANFVNMEIPTSGIVNRYIAGQGPLPHTAGDFWTAVWEQLCTTVVMLTDTVERGRVKCHQYWPRLNEKEDTGSLQITCIRERETPSTATREFSVVNNEVRGMRDGCMEPMIVHCSAGIGRTGVLILMETAMCLIEANQPVYPLDIVRTMRDQRPMLIQTSCQYKFVCDAIVKVYKDGYVKPAPLDYPS